MNIDIRGDNVKLPEHTREVIERKVRLSLGRLAGAIRAVRVTIQDVNGPKDGVDQRCAVQVHLARGGEAHVSAEEEALQDVVDRALERATRATIRMMERQRGDGRRGSRVTAEGQGY